MPPSTSPRPLALARSPCLPCDRFTLGTTVSTPFHPTLQPRSHSTSPTPRSPSYFQACPFRDITLTAWERSGAETETNAQRKGAYELRNIYVMQPRKSRRCLSNPVHHQSQLLQEHETGKQV